MDGDWYTVHCALRGDLTAPASELLDDLDEGVWADPQAVALPDEYQANVRRRLLVSIEALAMEGTLPRGAFNRLEEGIWELKVANLRLSFFDTDGNGGYTPKIGEAYTSWNGRTEYDLPEFDEKLRLGHYFAKTAQRTSNEDLEACKTVRLEDVAHDKEPGPEAVA